jgi:hypothetical protein
MIPTPIIDLLCDIVLFLLNLIINLLSVLHGLLQDYRTTAQSSQQLAHLQAAHSALLIQQKELPIS